MMYWSERRQWLFTWYNSDISSHTKHILKCLYLHFLQERHCATLELFSVLLYLDIPAYKPRTAVVWWYREEKCWWQTRVSNQLLPKYQWTSGQATCTYFWIHVVISVSFYFIKTKEKVAGILTMSKALTKMKVKDLAWHVFI